MFLKKCNYKIYDKELLIIVKAFEEWCFKIYDIFDSVIVLTDHKNLKYFIIICKLNCCQVCWNEFFSEFNFNIIYWLEVINSVTDALICCAGDNSCNEKNPCNAHQYQIILGDQWLQLNIFNVYKFNAVNMITVALIILWN